MSKEPDLKLECYEAYHGDAQTVLEKINNCHLCGAKLVFAHFPDHQSYQMQENAKCVECGQSYRRTLSKMN